MPRWRRTAATCLPLTVAVVALLLSPADGAFADEGAHGSANPAPIGFLQDVLPALTKAGCNSGTCHGAPQGRNGFRLSLRGFDPELDADTLVRETQARRVNRLDPAQSLILRKATAEIPHEGGRRFSRDGALYNLIHDWIAAGAPDHRGDAVRLSRLEIAPVQAVLDAPADFQPLRVTARYTDGTSRDVTHLARFTVNDETLAEVDWEGVVHKRKAGEVAVSAEYMNVLATSLLLFRDAAPDFAWPGIPEHNEIDRHVFAKLRELRTVPAEPAGDAVFLRRAFLDVIGLLPTPDEARAFLADPAPDKCARLIDTLLERPEFADWWAMKWADRLGCNQRFVGKIGAIKYHAWIRNALAVNMPEDEFARAVLTAQGGNYGDPPAGFFRRLRDPQTRAEESAQLFLGVRLQCARCHNHPGERWTQDDYYGLSAFFARLGYRDGPFFIQVYDKEETVFAPHTGELTHPRTGQPVAPRFLGGAEAEIPPGADRRELLADWLTAPDNPFFARTAVNRVWFHLLGRGIVEPVDDFRGSNPPSHPALLDALAADFVEHGFDRKRLIRLICNSQVYQLGPGPGESDADDERYFSRALVRLLPAEALLDAVSAATGVPESFPGLPAGTRAVSLPDGEYKHPFLEAFGRPARAMTCECERDSETSLSQALHVTGGATVQHKLRSDDGRIPRLLAQGRSDDEIIEELFLATLTRFPTNEEADVCRRLLTRSDNRRHALEDVLWTLLNHREFLMRQ